MCEKLKDYCSSLIGEVPHDVYVMLLITFCAGTVMAIGLKGWRRGLRLSLFFLLIEYIFLLYGSTVFFRDTMRELKYNFTPFWSYVEIANGDKTGLLTENVMNVIMFVPVGFLLGCAFRFIKWWQVLIIGIGLSVLIEVLQYLSCRGFSEFDDIMHNTLGCMIGYMMIQFFCVKRVLDERNRKGSVDIL